VAVKDYATGNRNQMEQIRDEGAFLAGLPVKGYSVGGGLHEVISDDPVSSGWSFWVSAVFKHPDREDYAYEAPVELTRRAALIARLPPQAAARVAAAGPLADDWFLLESPLLVPSTKKKVD
jgi:hypothetical protein